MKFILLFLISLSMFGIHKPKPIFENDLKNLVIEEFLNEVDKQYEFYKEHDHFINDIYDCIVIKGIMNNKACYGICYTNNKDNYNFTIKYGDVRYKFDKQFNNGNCYCIAIKSEEPITAFISNKDGEEKEIFKLQVFLKSSFNSTAIPGDNMPGEFNQMSKAKLKSPIIKVFTFVSLTTIAIFSILILLLFIFKKGFFNKEKRKIGVMNLKELYESSESTIIDEDELFSTINEDTNKKEVYNDFKEENNEVSKINDVKEYLRSLGYITDYKLLNEEEKNEIMLKLMFLKDNGDISTQDYLKETKELWKK